VAVSQWLRLTHAASVETIMYVLREGQ